MPATTHNTTMSEETELGPFASSSRRSSINNSSGIFEESGWFQAVRPHKGATLVWRDLSVYVRVGKWGKPKLKRILNGVTGAVKPGSLVALMGASGAGKSTLMTTLACRHAGDCLVDGDILINGDVLDKNIKRISGFTPQEDIFVPSLTVLEHLTIMAKLKLDRKTTKNQISRKIYELTKSLNLGKTLHTKIGAIRGDKGLSGGEKKRLTFATELLTDPQILFCDEPTTGLDSYSAQKIITIMNTMSYNGKTVLCTIHQPSSHIFAMFSQIILLAEGRTAFIGSPASALDFFARQGHTCPSSYNPSDFFIKTLACSPGYEDSSKQTIKRICDQFAVSDHNNEVDVVVRYEFHMGRPDEEKNDSKIAATQIDELYACEKLFWLTYRWLLGHWRNPTLHFVKFVQRIVLGLVVGLGFLGTISLTQPGIQNIQGVIYLLVTENTFMPMYAILNEFPHMHPLFLREYKSGLYSTPIYYLSRIISMLPGLILDPALFVGIIYGIAGLRMSFYAYFMTTVAAVLTFNAASACGVFFSNAFDSAPAAMAVLVPFDYVLLLTSGLFINLRTLPLALSWCRYFSWLMYSTESMFIIQWNGVKNISCDVSVQEFPCLTAGSQVLEKYFFNEDNLLRDLCSLVFLCIGFYALGFACLWWKARRK